MGLDGGVEEAAEEDVTVVIAVDGVGPDVPVDNDNSPGRCSFVFVSIFLFDKAL